MGFLVEARSAVKRVLGISDPYGDFRRFRRRILPACTARREELFGWAEAKAAKARSGLLEAIESSDDLIVRRGHELRTSALNEFRGCCTRGDGPRVLVHVPPVDVSPAGYSLFGNLVRALEYVGVPARALEWGESLEEVLDTFAPTVLMSSDHPVYLDRLEAGALAAWRREHPLLFGLTASTDDEGLAPLEERLLWARAEGVDFFYGFRVEDYHREHPGYVPFFEAGYEIVSIEFGADVLEYYPVPGVERDLDYVFLASSNRSKWGRLIPWLEPVLSGHIGFLDGPGWDFDGRTVLGDLPRAAERWLYARARVGLNLHLDDQLARAGELNERTYQLAACGVPQLVDNPALLPRRFRRGSLYSAATKGEYLALFRYILEHPEEAAERAMQALEDVYRENTLFHRARSLVRRLEAMAEGDTRT